MAIPDYHGLVQPALRVLAETGDDTGFQPLMDHLACRLGLTTDMITERLPSGTDTVFANRLHWALAYLQSAGLVAERQGAYRSTDVGSAHVADDQPLRLEGQNPQRPSRRPQPRLARKPR